ncbi:triose-phosphate transporter family-domain-containing protein [Pisolithus marmoratus]|nr:triose-phosphate transporter family-domain-containing protein [Pisolithus marmoratus]
MCYRWQSSSLWIWFTFSSLPFPRPLTPLLSMADHGIGGSTHGAAESQPHANGGTSIHLISSSEKKRLWWRNAAINTCFIMLWYGLLLLLPGYGNFFSSAIVCSMSKQLTSCLTRFTFATVLSVYNKWMFSFDHFGFPYPLFVTTIHMLIQFILAAALRFIHPRRYCPESRPNWQAYGTKAVPAAISTSVDIGLSNVSLKTITLSFYTMCKSSSLIFVLIFAFLFRLEKFSLRLVAVILVIFGGVLLMVASETAFVLSGFILVMTASVCSGLRWSLTQLLMRDKNMGMDSPAAAIFWLTPIMGVTLAIISILWEGWDRVFSTPFFNSLASTINTTVMLTLPGFLAFCMVMSEYYIIQRAGVLPMSIAGIAKEVSTITISAWFFGDELTPLNITGVVITTCGIALFTYHKYRKTVDSHVALDTLGNTIRADDDSILSPGRDFELNVARPHTTRPKACLQRHEDDEIHQHLLFSSEELEEGEEDAEELRSIRTSKLMQADENSSIGNGQADEESHDT